MSIGKFPISLVQFNDFLRFTENFVEITEGESEWVRERDGVVQKSYNFYLAQCASFKITKEKILVEL